MRKSGQCPKCAGKNVVEAMAVSSADPTGLSLYVFHEPDALVFKKRQSSPVATYVCTKCGYVEFYAKRPAVFAREGL